MNPNLFLETQDDSNALLGAFVKVGMKDLDASARRETLENAGVELPAVQLDGNAVAFARRLVAAFKVFCVSERRPDYHPMLALVEHLALTDEQFALYNFDDEDRALFVRLLERGRENLKALGVRRSVGMIEDAQGKGIGTGTLVADGTLLTCRHVFDKTGVKTAWVRFGYRMRCGGRVAAAGAKFELDLEAPAESGARLDFAVLRVKGEAGVPALRPAPAPVSGREAVRLIHHPGGGPVEVSEWGTVRQVGEDYLDHDVPTRAGSSGAPIFNRDWEFVALHRGDPGVGRAVAEGTTEGLPIRKIWNTIEAYV